MANFVNTDVLVDVRVPGNILLSGEYAVTRPLGKGFSAAVNCYVKGSLTEGSGIASGLSNAAEFDIDSRLIDSVIEASSRHGINIEKVVSKCNVFVDSSDFYDSTGRKLGLGSSAAAILCIVTLYAVHAVSYADALDLAAIAYEAHNLFQGHRGSGYDVYTSVMGGCNIFTGGGSSVDLPRIEQRPMSFLKDLYLISGPDAVKTGSSIAAFEAWLGNNEKLWESMYNENQGIAEALASAESLENFTELIELAAKWGQDLGGRIGVPADIDFPAFSGVCKALGAGNELAILIPKNELPPSIKGVRHYKVDRGGLIWRA